ncbi:hypothetical protein JAAARDRAFT_641968 [Jaapia argillacea MUCL 33604]|uniref:Uncharacterized protein n=1 Tax=Jaapia argillacea MUCL 33604 TaxID=933084 RepID=A0A067PES3_9AGAM|nr:hypothetical protein JAAARDRAFT_641968 [Jaapia argillacea MUCL 33604]
MMFWRQGRDREQFAVLVGPVACGKTCLAKRFTAPIQEGADTISSLFQSSTSDHDRTTASTDIPIPEPLKRDFRLTIRDSPWLEDHDCSKPHFYRRARVVLLCFAIDDVPAFEAMQQHIIPRVRIQRKSAPIILVGCKVDKRRSGSGGLPDRALVTTDAGEALARHIKAFSYLECSAQTGDGVEFLFESAHQLAFDPLIKRMFRVVKNAIGRARHAHLTRPNRSIISAHFQGSGNNVSVISATTPPPHHQDFANLRASTSPRNNRRSRSPNGVTVMSYGPNA